MRKHDVRKFIHAICDLLPLLVIPIFAIFVRNENYTSNISLSQEVNVYEDVDFNQNYNRNANFTRHFDMQTSRVWSTYVDNTLNIGHIYLLKFYCSNLQNNNNNIIGVNYGVNDNSFGVWPLENNSWCYLRNTVLSGGTFNYWYLVNDISSSVSCDIYYFNFYDLTQMFGSGYEPSIEEFLELYPNDYYSFTISTPMTIKIGTEIVTYNDTDVGSQMVYTLYNTVDKYFNFNQVQPFGDLYNIIVTNFFGGVSPLGLYIVWNVVLFEFFMDVLFLVYMVFMFIIDFTESMIDKAFYKSNRGCR